MKRKHDRLLNDSKSKGKSFLPIRRNCSLNILMEHYFDCYCPDLMSLNDYDRFFEATYLSINKTGLVWKI
ncbi:MAG: hypothetical protein IPH57_17400 [Saprospiraceae bacterium]|nr:hypothetical protein [Saprospiraceae bacterium]